MLCPRCGRPITPGMAVNLDVHGRTRPISYCPYCLGCLPTISAEADTETDVSVERFTLRREVRHRFVEQLVAASPDGQIRCPICSHALNNNSLLALRSAEHFICPHCSRDLADEAYRREAYDARSWLSVISTLAEEKANDTCANCSTFGAAAKACQQALSWIHGDHGNQHKLLATLVRHPDRNDPDDDCRGACRVVRQYKEQVGKRLLLL